MVNYTRLACMLRIYRKCNTTVGFWKYEFNNKLLVYVTFNNKLAFFTFMGGRGVSVIFFTIMV